jgi:hypothetical protein
MPFNMVICWMVIFVQLEQPVMLAYPVIYEDGVDVFHVGKADQFIDISVIPDIAF